MDEALRAKAREQPLGHSLLKMQVNGILGEHASILENNGPDRRFAAPLGERLVLISRCSEGVERRGPARVGLRSAIEGREVPDRSTCVVTSSHERLGTENLKRAGERRSERCRLEARPYTGSLEQGATTLDLRLQVFLALPRCLELFLRDAFLLRVEVRPLDLACELVGVAMPNALS